MKLIFNIPLKVPYGTLNGTLKDKYCPWLKMRLYNIGSFSCLDIRREDNRKMLQEYLKYLFVVTNLILGTIRIKQTYIKEFFRYLEEQEKAILTIDAISIKEYFEKLSMQRINSQSYKNKIRAVTIFLQYLQVKDDICYKRT